VKPVEGHSGSRFVQAAFWIGGLFSLIMALLPHPPHVPLEPSDKIQHAIAFATLGLLGGFGFPRLSALKLIGGLSLYGALDRKSVV